MLGVGFPQQHPREKKNIIPTLKCGARGRGDGLGMNGVNNVVDKTYAASKSVPHYFRLGMDAKMRKHPLYAGQAISRRNVLVHRILNSL